MIDVIGETPLRILDFDIENAPISYLGSDWTTGLVTAIAWGLYPKGKIEARVLGEVDHEEMLEEFREEYGRADLVTGHYILKHDLPVLNRAMLRVGLPPLEPKMVSDTKLHLPKGQYVSASQENLSELLGVKAGKFHMNAARWERANVAAFGGGDPSGLELTRRRVTDDVRQHRQLRARLIELGHLGPAKMWRP